MSYKITNPSAGRQFLSILNPSEDVLLFTFYFHFFFLFGSLVVLVGGFFPSWQKYFWNVGTLLMQILSAKQL